MPAITVRFRIKNHWGEWRTDWVETTRSWTKAWSIVDDCEASGLPAGFFDLSDEEQDSISEALTMKHRATCHKWQCGDEWFLDIGGAEEQAERKANLDRLLAFD